MTDVKEIFFYVSVAGQIVSFWLAFIVYFSGDSSLAGEARKSRALAAAVALNTGATIGLMLAVFGGF